MEERLDCFGRPLQVGDTVATYDSSYAGLRVGKIVKFTPTGVKLDINAFRVTNCYNVVKKVT